MEPSWQVGKILLPTPALRWEGPWEVVPKTAPFPTTATPTGRLKGDVAQVFPGLGSAEFPRVLLPGLIT